MFKVFVAVMMVVGLSGCSCCSCQGDVQPERLNERHSVADQASSRTPEGVQLGNTLDKGPQKSDIPILRKVLKDDEAK